MAAGKAGAVANRKNTLPTDWEKQMREDAAKGRAREANVGVSPRIKTRGGILAFMDTPMPGNKMQAVILAASLENGYYPDEFDADNPVPPVCFAFGTEEAEMRPHDASTDKQSEDCASCWANKFGSAEKGRGKACKNQRHLIVMHADSLKTAAKSGTLKDAQIASANIPPTSLPSWAQYIRQLEANSGKPQYAFVTEMAIVPDAKTQWKFTFNPMKEIEKKIMPLVFVRAREAEKELAERPPYQALDDGDKPGKGKPGAKKPAGKKPAQQAGRAAATSKQPRKKF